jgi:GDP-L-fucose synthase
MFDIDKESRVLITGGSGLLGHALENALRMEGCRNVIALSSRDLNLLDREATISMVTDTYRPQYVFHLAGTVFGLGGNLREPGRIFEQNTLMSLHIIEAARLSGAQKVVGMGSICAYPFPPRSRGPLVEEDLLFGEPHPGERAYGHAKRAMLAQLEAYQSSYGMDYAFAISTNLYGPHDRFNIENGHVIPSLIRKFFEAAETGKTVELWGDGTSTRDFMHVDDAARALIAIMKCVSGRINLATGTMSTIGSVAEILGDVSGVGHRVRFDSAMPKGHEFHGIDVSKLRETGFSAARSLEQGLRSTYEWYSRNHLTART